LYSSKAFPREALFQVECMLQLVKVCSLQLQVPSGVTLTAAGVCTWQVLGANVPVHIVSYNSPDQETVIFLKSLAQAVNTKYKLVLLASVLRPLSYWKLILKLFSKFM